MRKLSRSSISVGLRDQLRRQGQRIRRLRPHGVRYVAARANWKLAGKKKLRKALELMTGGHDRCMYCEYSQAGTVDHFCPIGTDPKQAFHWRNLLLACQPCQNAKNDNFTKELLNPARNGYEPWAHMDLEPTTGEYVLNSIAAKSSGPIFRWDRAKLPLYRWKSLRVFQAAIVAYATARTAGDDALAEVQVEVARLEPHPGVFDWILHWCAQGPPAAGADPLDARVRAAVANHPEIQTWL